MAVEPSPSKSSFMGSLVGRFLSVLHFALVGLIGGLLYGAYSATRLLADIPGHGKNVEPGTIEPFTLMAWVIGLGSGAIGGVVVGTLAGAVWAIVKPRARH